MNQKTDAKIRRFEADSKEIAVFFNRLLRLAMGFATKGRNGH